MTTLSITRRWLRRIGFGILLVSLFIGWLVEWEILADRIAKHDTETVGFMISWMVYGLLILLDDDWG